MPRPMFIRARMKVSGDEFDTTADSVWIRDGHAVRVKPKLYPPSPRPRPAKYRPRALDLTATSAVEPNADAETVPAQPDERGSHHG